MTNFQRSYRIEVRNTRYHYTLATVADDGNGNPLDKVEAERIGRILRAMNSKSEDVEVTVHANPIPMSAAMQALGAVIGSVVVDGLKLPQISFDDSSVTVTLPDNERGLVDQWAAALGLSVHATATGLGRYYARYAAGGETDAVPGWSVEVTCQLHTQQHASAHGDDLDAPDPQAYAAWKAARDAEQNVAVDEPVTPATVAKKKARVAA